MTASKFAYRLGLLPAAVVLTIGACGAADQGTAEREPAQTTAGASAQAGVRLVKVGDFDTPVYVTSPPRDRRRIFVVEKTGRIRVVRDGKKLGSAFLDVSSKVTDGYEQGLLSMAFAPDYARSRRFYVDYTDRNGDSRIVEYKRSLRNANRAEASSARLVLFQDQPEANHNGGQLQFGPDGLLYIGFGDGGGADDHHGAGGNGQSLSTVLGKVLRIDPRPKAGRRYRIPADNPFVRRRGARHEIYAYGLRNPWRFSFDRLTGDLTIGDVGQDNVEEVDFARRGAGKGRNYGWRVYEGDRLNFPGEAAPGAVRPVLTYPTHVGGTCSVTGGYVVRDRTVSALYGRYVYGDNCVGELHLAKLAPGSASGDRALGLHVSSLSSFGEDARGRVYAASLDGPVYRLAGG